MTASVVRAFATATALAGAANAEEVRDPEWFGLWTECAPLFLSVTVRPEQDELSSRILTVAESRLRAARIYKTVEGTKPIPIDLMFSIVVSRGGGNSFSSM